MTQRIKNEKQDAIQNALSKSSSEVNELQHSVSRLREELDRCDIIKKEEVQKAVASHQREITHFKRMVSALRDELDHKDILFSFFTVKLIFLVFTT